jgi:hypothetical protein
MTSSLQLLFQESDGVEDRQRLRSQVVPRRGIYFATKRVGIFFFNEFVNLSPNVMWLMPALFADLLYPRLFAQMPTS